MAFAPSGEPEKMAKAVDRHEYPLCDDGLAVVAKGLKWFRLPFAGLCFRKRVPRGANMAEIAQADP